MITPRLEKFLADQHTPYSHSIHSTAYTAREVAYRDHTPLHAMAKTVVFVGDGCFGLAVVPANTFVELNRLRDALGVAVLRLATEEEIVRLFPDTEAGAMSPFGNLYGVPVYVDETLTQEETIAFNAGTHRDVIHMKYRDFEWLTAPIVFRFARHS
jgi:Ala-tRNA(Pro) deacylase